MVLWTPVLHQLPPNTPAHLHIITGPSSSNIYPGTHIHCFKRHTIKPDGKKSKKEPDQESGKGAD